jgi:hypothetical protein
MSSLVEWLGIGAVAIGMASSIGAFCYMRGSKERDFVTKDDLCRFEETFARKDITEQRMGYFEIYMGKIENLLHRIDSKVDSILREGDHGNAPGK